MPVVDITETSQLKDKKCVLLFWAPWHESSAGPMQDVLEALASNNTDSELLFGRVHAEQVAAVSVEYSITVVPTFLLLNRHGHTVSRMEGDGQVAAVTTAVQQLVALPDNVATNETAKEEEESLTDRLNRLITSSTVMLFMKGTPTAPRCGFSRQAVELLRDVPFASFDILQDEEVRQELKTFSNWPTYPQIYVKGELVGGLDILKELAEEPESLAQQWGLEEEQVETLTERLERLTKQADVMLFMKGLPSAPRCGFSRQIVDLLQDELIAFDAFDILQDEEVRQGLKTFSNWPTFPQLYVKGELVGGLDIVKEMKEDDGSLKGALGLE